MTAHEAPTGAAAAAAARDAIERAVTRIRAEGIAPDPLATLDPARRVLGIFPRAERLRRSGEGWRLGALIVTTTGELVVGAQTARAKRYARVGYTAESSRERDALRHAAARGGFSDGTTVHVGGAVVDFDELVARAAAAGGARPAGEAGPAGPAGRAGPVGEASAAHFGMLAVRADEIVVRWAPGISLAAAQPLAVYLDERVELLVHRPEGA